MTDNYRIFYHILQGVIVDSLLFITDHTFYHAYHFDTCETLSIDQTDSTMQSVCFPAKDLSVCLWAK